MPRRKTVDRWPWPHESVLDRREHLARIYRAALERVAPNECYIIDADAERFGQRWILPATAVHELDDMLTAELVADAENVTTRTVDLWVSRGLKVTSTPDGNRFLYSDVLAYRASRRQRRAVVAASAAGGVADVPSSA